MTHQTSDRLHVVGAWLNTLPLPEPYAVTVHPGLDPDVRWHYGGSSYTPLRIIATIGGDWTVHTYDEPQTIAMQKVDHLGTAINVTVVLHGASLPNLATDAAALGVGAV